MKTSTLIDVICASHLSYLVDSPWPERGGLCLVAPTGQVKTTVLTAISDYPGVFVTSDINTQMLGRLKDDMLAGRIRTIVIPDLQKIYERHPTVSSNVEGTLRAMMEEGFLSTSWQDASAISTKARAIFLTATTPYIYEKRLMDWRQTGFSRRIIFSVYSLADPNVIVDAVERWQRIEMDNGLLWTFPWEPIPYTVTRPEARKMRLWLHRQQDSTPFVLLQKIACVLRYRFKKVKKPDRTMEILSDFSESLSGEGARLEL